MTKNFIKGIILGCLFIVIAYTPVLYLFETIFEYKFSCQIHLLPVYLTIGTLVAIAVAISIIWLCRTIDEF